MKKAVAGFQWMAFMVAGSIVAPIAIANLFGLSPEESAGFVQRTMFILGLSSLLQGLVGHRLPINEGACRFMVGCLWVVRGFKYGHFFLANGDLKSA